MVYKLKETINDININITDINYNLKNNNKKEINRKQRLIFFGLNKNFSLSNKNETNEFFIELTFKIVPKNFRPYKLMVISGLPKTLNNPILLCFIFVK